MRDAVVALSIALLAAGCGNSSGSSQSVPTPTAPTPGPMPTGPLPTVAPSPLGAGDCASKRAAFEDALPVPVPSSGHYVVQLVNESGVTLLAGANAAHVADQPPKPVLPREGTWIIGPNAVLTVDVPPEWERTIPEGSVGPVFWARTGCRYDVAHNLAQCETGGCGGVYDCSAANATPPGPKALAEWTFDDPNHNAAPDISVVDGVNLNMDIEPIGPHSDTPVGPVDPAFWLGSANLPLTKCGEDLRAADRCPISAFQLKRGDLSFFVEGNGGDGDVIACFSNCGQYKFQGNLTGACPQGFRCPGEPPLSCNPDPASDPICYYWKTFCCAVPEGDPDKVYDKMCTSDAQCSQNAGCWDARGECSCRAFIQQETCPSDVCTNPYSQEASFQPPFGHCADLVGGTTACIGDDTMHEVMPRGLTWPNDPETYYSDAHAYRIVFAPGGTSVPITDSGPPPLCQDLPAAYGYGPAAQNCSIAIMKGATFAGARLPSQAPGVWDCDIANGIATTGVLCRWQ